MDPSRGILAGTVGTCAGFYTGFQKMQPSRPPGVSGNGNVTTNYPYGTTPIKYSPCGSSSVGRAPPDVWRYGSGYIGLNQGKVYGEPDYKYYRHNYCGPCGCGPEGFMGDPNGKNPNIRYVQLDYKNLLGSGLAQQNVGYSATSQAYLGSGPTPATQTSCGRNHCSHCSGVLKKNEQPVKFQVCIGDPQCPETMPPCPQQPLKVYVPTQMMPQGDAAGDQENCEGEGTEECGDGDGVQKKLQDFEIHIPGQTDQEGSQQNISAKMCPMPQVKSLRDPCGCCNACKKSCCIPQPKPPCSIVPYCPPQRKEWVVNGQRYTNGPILACAKKPAHPACLRK